MEYLFFPRIILLTSQLLKHLQTCLMVIKVLLVAQSSSIVPDRYVVVRLFLQKHGACGWGWGRIGNHTELVSPIFSSLFSLLLEKRYLTDCQFISHFEMTLDYLLRFRCAWC